LDEQLLRLPYIQNF